MISRTNFIIIVIILALIFLLMVSLVFYVIYQQSDSTTREECLTHGDRTECYKVTVNDDLGRFNTKFTRVNVIPVFKSNNKIPFNMVYKCTFDPNDLQLNSIMFGAGKDRPHRISVDKQKGEMELQFYSTYRIVDFVIRPHLQSFKINRIISEPYLVEEEN